MRTLVLHKNKVFTLSHIIVALFWGVKLGLQITGGVIQLKGLGSLYQVLCQVNTNQSVAKKYRTQFQGLFWGLSITRGLWAELDFKTKLKENRSSIQCVAKTIDFYTFPCEIIVNHCFYFFLLKCGSTSCEAR